MEACIICFLTDNYQNKLCNLAQSRNDRFEGVLSTYMTDFLFQYTNLIPIDACEKHRNLHTGVKQWAKDLQASLPSASSVCSYFGKISAAYTSWIKWEHDASQNLILDLLNQSDFSNKIYSKSKKVFFRARKSSELLSKEDLFHIPFNKRYLIGNQRYSVSGQPCLYLGLSIPDVISELRGNYTEYSQYAFSGFMLNSNYDLKLLAFTNHFPELLSTVESIIMANGKIVFDDSNHSPRKKECIEYFYLMILVRCCSFPRRNKSEGQAFSEEYVLPQLVTAFSHRHPIDGIVFSSTRINDKDIFSKATYFQSEYKSNVVLFTKYSDLKIYDYSLLDKFIISEPKKAESFEEISDIELYDLTSKIIKLNNKKHYFSSLEDLAEYAGLGAKNDFENIYIKTNSSEIRYYDHPLGKFHKYLLYCFLLDVRNKMA